MYIQGLKSNIKIDLLKWHTSSKMFVDCVIYSRDMENIYKAAGPTKEKVAVNNVSNITSGNTVNEVTTKNYSKKPTRKPGYVFVYDGKIRRDIKATDLCPSCYKHEKGSPCQIPKVEIVPKWYAKAMQETTVNHVESITTTNTDVVNGEDVNNCEVSILI